MNGIVFLDRWTTGWNLDACFGRRRRHRERRVAMLGGMTTYDGPWCRIAQSSVAWHTRSATGNGARLRDLPTVSPERPTSPSRGHIARNTGCRQRIRSIVRTST